MNHEKISQLKNIRKSLISELFDVEKSLIAEYGKPLYLIANYLMQVYSEREIRKVTDEINQARQLPNDPCSFEHLAQTAAMLFLDVKNYEGVKILFNKIRADRPRRFNEALELENKITNEK